MEPHAQCAGKIKFRNLNFGPKKNCEAVRATLIVTRRYLKLWIYKILLNEPRNEELFEGRSSQLYSCIYHQSVSINSSFLFVCCVLWCLICCTSEIRHFANLNGIYFTVKDWKVVLNVISFRAPSYLIFWFSKAVERRPV